MDTKVDRVGPNKLLHELYILEYTKIDTFFLQ